MKNVDMKFVKELLEGVMRQHRKKQVMVGKCRQAIEDLAAGKPDGAAKIFRDRFAHYSGVAPALLAGSGILETRQRLIEVQTIVRESALALDRLAEEYPPTAIWGKLFNGRQEDLKVQRAYEQMVLDYLDGRAQVCQGEPTNASAIYRNAAAQLELGNPEPVALLLRTELENCDSDSRLRDLAPKLRQMLDYLCEIYGPVNIWGENEDLIARHISAALDRVRSASATA